MCSNISLMSNQGQDTYSFENLGAREEHFEEFAQWAMHTEDSSAELARIVRVDRGFPLVTSTSGTYRAELSASLAKMVKRDASKRPAVGDWVALTHPAGHEMAIIVEILPRVGAFTRKDPGDDTGAQVVIANVDVVFVVIALSGDGVNVSRLERALVLAFESGATPIIVLTKADLCDDIDTQVKLAESVSAGVPIIVESAITGEGVEAIRELVGQGVTAAMIGASGVGKSTLINRLVGGEVQATAEVRDTDDKGRHTTVAREIVVLPGGGILIDTPGMRAIALWHADIGLESTYPEIYEAQRSCKFSDCAHAGEPGCGVAAAIASGAVDEARLQRYRALVAELEELAQRQEERRWRLTEKKGSSQAHPGRPHPHRSAPVHVGRNKKQR